MTTLDDKALRDLAHPMMDGCSFNNLFKAAEYGRLVRNAAFREAAELVQTTQEVVTTTHDGTERSLNERRYGNLMGTAYAEGIRALIPPGET